MSLTLNIDDRERMHDDSVLRKREANGDGMAPSIKQAKLKKNGLNLVELAKSGRAKCKQCGELMAKDILRFGYTSRFHGNEVKNWMVRATRRPHTP